MVKKAIVGIVLVLSVVLFSNCSYSEDKGLVGYWKFDESKGEIAKDFSGNGNNGKIHGATATAGKIGQALSFNGVDNYVNCGKKASLDIGTGNFTICAWVKPAVAHSGSIYSNVRGGSSPGMEIAFYGSYIRFQGGEKFSIKGRDTRFNTPKNSVSIGVWNHIVVTREDVGSSNQTMKIYINGIEKATNSDVLRNMNSNSDNYIGLFRKDLRAFNGRIDEVRIYNRALTETEVENLYKTRSQVI